MSGLSGGQGARNAPQSARANARIDRAQRQRAQPCPMERLIRARRAGNSLPALKKSRGAQIPVVAAGGLTVATACDRDPLGDMSRGLRTCSSRSSSSTSPPSSTPTMSATLRSTESSDSLTSRRSRGCSSTSSRASTPRRPVDPIRTAAVLAFQSFGDLLRHNPYYHEIVLEGGFDAAGRFVFIPLSDLARMTQDLRRRVIKFFRECNL